jgi:flagellum-specific ATP synthase
LASPEVGLSVVVPSARRSHPRSVSFRLPALLECVGRGSVGSITGLYTLLVEGDDHNEPIADAARSILDGHIVLDRKLATAGHFPSVQALDSISRVANRITTPEQQRAAAELRRIMAAHRDVRELVEIGAYVPGTNPDADRAAAIWPQITAFLRQGLDEKVSAADAWQALRELIASA